MLYYLVHNCIQIVIISERALSYGLSSVRGYGYFVVCTKALEFHAAILNTIVTSRTWARARRAPAHRLTFESRAVERGDDASKPSKCNSVAYSFAYVLTDAKSYKVVPLCSYRG